MPNTAQSIAAALAVASASTLQSALAMLRQRMQGNPTAEATLTMVAADPQSTYLQQRLCMLLEQQYRPDELEALQRTLTQADTQPGVQSSITAEDDGLIQDSGHHIIAPTGSVRAETTARRGGQIIGSEIRIVGTATPPAPAMPSPPAPVRRRLPAALSADGQHFSYGHALLIGVGQYQQSRLSVPDMTTANDAAQLAQLLCAPQYAAYPQQQVQLLCNAQATRSQILSALDSLAQRLAHAPNSTALIFFAGHGASSADGYALLPYDSDTERLADTGVTAALFHQAITRLRTHARRLVVLLNCCHAGGVGGSVLGTDAATLAGAAPPPDFYRPLATGSGQVVISSSRPDQKSSATSEHDPQHSTFGAHLLDALKGKAPGSNPGIGVFELFSYLRVHVPRDASGIWYDGTQLVQEPLFYASQLDDNIAVALRPQDRGATLGIPADHSQRIARLVELERQIAITDGAVPQMIVDERDRVLRELERVP